MGTCTPVPAHPLQVQRLKLDTEAAMLEMDQILRANVGAWGAWGTIYSQ
jgi:hypothetical protein